MAVPHVVTTQRYGSGEHPLPAAAQPGDLIVWFVDSSVYLSDLSNYNGKHGSAAIMNATGSLGAIATATDSWVEYYGNDNRLYRGWAHRLRAYVATVPGDPARVILRNRTGGSHSNSEARVVILRNAAGPGATATGVWRVPTQDDQSIALFAGGQNSLIVPAGVTELGTNNPGAWTAPSTGPHAGPGGPSESDTPSNEHALIYLLGLEIQGTTGPGEPILVDPPHGSEAPNGVPIELRWQHQPARQGGRQDAYILEVTHMPDDPTDGDPVTRWWDGVTLVNVETVVESPSQTVELPPSLVGEDRTVAWAVATREALDGEWSRQSTASSFSTVDPPTVTVTGPSGPVHNTMRPVIEWDATPAPGKALVGYQVRVTDGDGTGVFDTDPQTGSPGLYSVPALPTWVNGAAYTPWVRVRQSGGAWSAWEQGDPFVVSWDEPETPTVAAWPKLPGVLVEASAPGLLAAEIERVNPDGTTSPVAQEAIGGTTNDVLAPYGQTVTYRARTSNTIADVTVYSEWAESGPVVSGDRYGYLADANNPARWVRFRQAEAAGYAPARQYETEYGLGDTRGMVNKGPQLGKEGTLTARTDTPAEEAELLEMLETVDLLVIRWPAEQRFAGVSQQWIDRGTTLVTVNGGPRVEPLSRNYPLTTRLISFDWIEQ